jgi:hypothetical protein
MADLHERIYTFLIKTKSPLNSGQTHTFIQISYFRYLIIGLYVHFLCMPKENEPKERALSPQCFLLRKTADGGLNFLQGFGNF